MDQIIDISLILLISGICAFHFQKKNNNSIRHRMIFLILGFIFFISGSLLFYAFQGQNVMLENILLKQYDIQGNFVFIARKCIFVGYCFSLISIILYFLKKQKKGNVPI